MQFPTDFRTLNIKFKMGNLWVKAIDANHGVFTRPFPRHMHSFYELHYVSGGKGELLTDENVYPLSEGDAYLIGPKLNHEQLSDKLDPLEEFHFAFELTRARGEKNVACCDVLSETVFWHGRDEHGLKMIFDDLEAELIRKEIGYTIKIRNCLERILISTVRDINNITGVSLSLVNLPDEKRHSIVDDAFLYSYKTITLEGLAELLNLSCRQTQRIIKERYSMNFSEMRTKSRLNAAANFLILEQKYTIDQITEMTGFSNRTYFSSLFKKQFGLSPVEYRKRHK